jgi:polyhydroxyalkanoate synthesis repressor PhaR
MPVIKRYPNRKLYNTESKQYITLEEISELIRRGQNVSVVDNATGEDLTALTLTQVIFEQEKKQSGFLPHSILTDLIQAGGDRLSTLQQTLASSIGLWRHVDDEIKRRIQALVKQGEIAEAEGQRLLEKLLSLGRHTPGEETPSSSDELEKEIEKLLEARKVPSRNEIDDILQQLETLAGKLDELNPSANGPE